MKYDLLHIQGKPYVLVPLHDYREISSTGTDSALPNEVLDELSAQQSHPIRIIRKFREMTQADLAEASGISRPYLTEIETGKKDGSIRALKSLAEGLGVTIGDIT
ncbi:MAG: transcriptional regulator [Zetaproteobacteria bacterium]|nr:MAG: transcriptional regulator [Zetaproteobacteria bacterium]